MDRVAILLATPLAWKKGMIDQHVVAEIGTATFNVFFNYQSASWMWSFIIIDNGIVCSGHCEDESDGRAKVWEAWCKFLAPFLKAHRQLVWEDDGHWRSVAACNDGYCPPTLDMKT